MQRLTVGRVICIQYGRGVGDDSGAEDRVAVGHILVGGDAPVVVQSMTDTDTADIIKTVEQVNGWLWRAPSSFVALMLQKQLLRQLLRFALG